MWCPYPSFTRKFFVVSSVVGGTGQPTAAPSEFSLFIVYDMKCWFRERPLITYHKNRNIQPLSSLRNFSASTVKCNETDTLVCCTADFWHLCISISVMFWFCSVLFCARNHVISFHKDSYSNKGKECEYKQIARASLARCGVHLHMSWHRPTSGPTLIFRDYIIVTKSQETRDSFDENFEIHTCIW